jgi:predicted Zn-ribbon and HTH transcriptional regulator
MSDIMTIQKRVCKRVPCGHEWWPLRDKEPKTCPKCHSALWNEEPRENVKEKGGAYAPKKKRVKKR